MTASCKQVTVTNLLLLLGAVLPCAGIPRALLGHQVAVVGLRPAFPDFTPYEYRNLAERCWIQEPGKRWGLDAGLPCPSTAAGLPARHSVCCNGDRFLLLHGHCVFAGALRYIAQCGHWDGGQCTSH
jgi:hypothetical protein